MAGEWYRPTAATAANTGSRRRDLGGARDGELVVGRTLPARRYGPPRVKIVERLGQPGRARRLQPAGHRRLRHPDRVPRRRAGRGGGGKAGRTRPAGPICANWAWSRSTAATRAISTTRCGPNRIRMPPIRAAGTSSSRSPTSRTMSRRAARSTARRNCAAIRSISPTGSCRCCPRRCRTGCARWCRTRTAPASRRICGSTLPAASAGTASNARSCARRRGSPTRRFRRRATRRTNRRSARSGSTPFMARGRRSIALASPAMRSPSTLSNTGSCSTPTELRWRSNRASASIATG